MSKGLRELYEFGPYHLDASRRLLERDGEVLHLASKTFETLLVLVRNRDRVLTKEELMKVLWPDSFVEEVNLAQNVSALRKILGETPGQNRYIATVPGKGYRFVGEVREWGNSSEEITIERHTQTHVMIQEEKEEATNASEEILVQGSGLRSWIRSRPGIAAVIGGLVACVAAGGVYFWRTRQSNAKEMPVHSLAVLPFRFLAGEDDPPLALGVTDAVITKLGNIHELTVRPTDEVMRYSSPNGNAKDIARQLQVDSFLSGRIQKSGDRIRVTVQLMRVGDGNPLWAQTFDEKFTNIFAVEDSISEQVTEALAVNLADAEKQQLRKHYTENIDAYRNYLAGRYEEFQYTRDGMNKAIGYFNRAIDNDPSYALAYAGLADAYTTESDWLFSPREALPKAEAAARKALAFDDSLAEGHEALAHVLLHEWRLADADREFHRALILNPESTTIYLTYGEYLASIGKEDQAIEQMNKALTIDPLSPEVNSFLAWDLYLKRDYDACLASSHKAMQMFPDFWLPHLTAGMCLSVKGQYGAAVEEFQRARAMNPESTSAQGGLGVSYAKAGNTVAARKVLQEMEDASKKGYVSPAYIALVYDALGDRNAEFADFAKAYDDQSEYLLWLTIDPLLDDVRGDPRFEQLLRRVGVSR